MEIKELVQLIAPILFGGIIIWQNRVLRFTIDEQRKKLDFIDKMFSIMDIDKLKAYMSIGEDSLQKLMNQKTHEAEFELKQDKARLEEHYKKEQEKITNQLSQNQTKLEATEETLSETRDWLIEISRAYLDRITIGMEPDKWD